ncbi:MAG TPA: branched-chain amino acid ABC transporter substrate-binding protein [Anaerolineaceae bacterium]|nr:MAG: branched-chain amino acid ABC transporter substrate-binding protein [Chloroflexi bacterium GWB2_54_36]HAL17667.1 branched-chain amino acid ABC transporter substrate-binding protein [Anaerolineaceae bacterium]HBA90368.1 branched-chain amino acid ABC transporter substrate-binding protein [Anaerolineaceae bacterium]
MRSLKVLSLFVILSMILVACGGTGSTGGAKELKVAILAPLSGPVPTFGVSTRDGALLAIEEWNAKGGVNGYTIVPIVEDSQCTPEPAVNAMNKVVDQDGVKFVIGEVCSKATIPISEIGTAKKVIVISGTSTAEAVTVDANGNTKPYTFRACFIDAFQGLVGAKFATEKLGAKTTFIMLDQANDYVKGLAEEFEKNFTAMGGTVVGKESYTAKDTDFSTILAKIAEAKPDVVYLPDYYNIVNLVTKQAKEKGITSAFLGGDGWDSADLDVVAAAGGYFTNHYSPDDPRPEVVNFLAAYGAKYKNDDGTAKVPDALATLAYDAANMLFTAMTTAGTVEDVDKVKVALEGIKINAVSGAITLDAKHNPVKAAAILAVTAEGVKFEASIAP